MLMRKILAIIFIPLIVLSAGGMNIFRHYCHFHHHAFYSILQQPSCNVNTHACSHCGHDECDLVLKQNHCENTHVFVQTVKQPAPSQAFYTDFSQAAGHLFNILYTPFLKDFSGFAAAILSKDLVLWDTGIHRDKGAAFFSILFSSLKIDC